MSPIDVLLDALAADPADATPWVALADALEEHGDAAAIASAEATRLSLWLRTRLDDPEHPVWQQRLRALVAQGTRVCLPRWTVLLGAEAELPLVLIPPGAFWMGSPESEDHRGADERRHRVRLTNGVWMGIYPVTQAQWRAITGESPSFFPGDHRPVERVSQDECAAFCVRLSERVGRTARLPTEAEWEYACRAGTTTPYGNGERYEDLHRVAWCSYDGVRGSAVESRPVGQLAANAWGLYDLHGNIMEWCADWYGPYPDSAATDPTGPNHGSARVHRGGSWYSRPWRCRSALRLSWGPEYRQDNCGCRVVVEVG